jgi:hypothetical protein
MILENITLMWSHTLLNLERIERSGININHLSLKIINWNSKFMWREVDSLWKKL